MQASGAEWPTGMVGHGDTISGTVLAGGICAALLQRERTGVASVVDGSLMGTAIWFNHQPIVAAKLGTTWGGGGQSREGRGAAMNNYRTKDGRFLSLVFLNDPDDWWADLCRHLDRPDLATDERFATAKARAANNAAAVEILDEIFAQRTLAEWRDVLSTALGVWAPVQSPAEIHDDPQTIANGFVREVAVPDGSDLPADPARALRRGGRRHRARARLRRAHRRGAHRDRLHRRRPRAAPEQRCHGVDSAASRSIRGASSDCCDVDKDQYSIVRCCVARWSAPTPEDVPMTVRSFEDKVPRLVPTAWVSEAAYVVGDVEIGADSSVWPGAVVRGDFGSIRIGENTVIEDNCVVHCAGEMVIGDHNIIGHAVTVHCAVLGWRCLVGNGSMLLDDSRIGDLCIVTAGSLVPPRTVVPDRSLVVGSPARIEPLAEGHLRALEGFDRRDWEYSYAALARATAPPGSERGRGLGQGTKRSPASCSAVCSRSVMTANSSGPAISGGASCTTGRTRSSMRAMSPSSRNRGPEEAAEQRVGLLAGERLHRGAVLHELERPEVARAAQVADDRELGHAAQRVEQRVLVGAHVREHAFVVEDVEVGERDGAAHRVTAEGEPVRERRGALEERLGEEVAADHRAER